MRRAGRFDSVSKYAAPEYAVRLAERRVGGMVADYQWQQTFSGALPTTAARPTMLDLAVSAYLQGVNDAAETFARRGLILPSADVHDQKERS